MHKHIGNCETEDYSLEVYECECGFHLGVDATYLDQVGDVVISCPSCSQYLHSDGLYPHSPKYKKIT